ncbi:hypothetical protein Avbf_18882 [Armadillidium vulgare]|nr:hypothetical protein Avbf_18882 [Armadillidium vulgare]
MMRVGCNSSIMLNDESPDKFKNNKEKTLERTEIWLSILDYIIRLVYQIGGLYTERDVSCLCKHFLKKLYQYFYYSPIKYIKYSAHFRLTLLIPKLTVDLVDGRLKDNCSQCSDIKRYVKEFLLNMKRYFNHHHQYGVLNSSSTFLLEFKGLDYMLSILSQPQQGNVYLYTYSFLVHDIQIFTERI